jgi:hypothetical protein
MAEGKFTEDDVIEYNLEVLPQVQDIEPTYSIVARARSHDIKRGDNIDIEIYVTGLGIPDTNKVVLLWASPNIIDPSSPGYFTYCIREWEGKIKGKDMIFPVASKELLIQEEVSPIGVELRLHKAFFLPTPDRERRDIPAVMAERNREGYPPISITLKTLRQAKSGASSVDVTFTYTHRKTIKQASCKVEFKVTSWWDRNQWWVLTVGSIAAAILLVLAAIGSYFE